MTAELKSLYDAGKFDKALEQLRPDSLRTAQDFYNAGLILYKNNQPEKAYAFFLKSKILAPSNEAATHGLNVASQKMRTNGVATSAPASITEKMSLFTKTLDAGWLGVPLGIVLIATALLFRSARRNGSMTQPAAKQPTFWAALGCLALAITLAGGFFHLRSRDLLVVQNTNLDVRSGPSLNFSSTAKLSPMTIVTFTGGKKEDENKKQWLQIEFGKDGLGWALEEDLLAL